MPNLPIVQIGWGRVLHWEGRECYQKNPQEIVKANGMPSLPTWQTQVTLRVNVVLWAFLGRPNYSHLALGGRVLHWKGREWSHKIS